MTPPDAPKAAKKGLVARFLGWPPVLQVLGTVLGAAAVGFLGLGGAKVAIAIIGSDGQPQSTSPPSTTAAILSQSPSEQVQSSVVIQASGVILSEASSASILTGGSRIAHRGPTSSSWTLAQVPLGTPWRPRPTDPRPQLSLTA